MSKHKPVPQALLSRLPFRSILTERPRDGQWILAGWEVDGYVGFESCFWDTDDFRCQHCCMWLPLYKAETNLGKATAIARRKPYNNKWPILDWHQHFSKLNNGRYAGKNKLSRLAEAL